MDEKTSAKSPLDTKSALKSITYGIKTPKYYILGLFAGILNGFFGSGGGLMVVPLLKSAGLETKKSHATSIAIILPLSVLSGFLCIKSGVPVGWESLIWLLPLGLLGGFLGSVLLKRINPRILSIIFGLVMIISAIRLLLR